MNFGQALEALKQGKKVARAHWGGYWMIRELSFGLWAVTSMGSFIVAVLKDNAGYAPATPYQEDILAEDWKVVE